MLVIGSRPRLHEGAGWWGLKETRQSQPRSALESTDRVSDSISSLSTMDSHDDPGRSCVIIPQIHFRRTNAFDHTIPLCLNARNQTPQLRRKQTNTEGSFVAPKPRRELRRAIHDKNRNWVLWVVPKRKRSSKSAIFLRKIGSSIPGVIMKLVMLLLCVRAGCKFLNEWVTSGLISVQSSAPCVLSPSSPLLSRAMTGNQ